MKIVFFLITISFAMNSMLLFDFNKESDIVNWKIVDDGVMGGLSSSDFSINENGHGVFKGSVSIENNGGFCSVRYFFKPITLRNQKTFSIRLKGDGKKYQFRVKSKVTDYYSYVYEFQTSSDWQTVEIPITEMYASFRGRTLNLPNYDGASLEEIAFLVGNKKNESFQMTIDKIEVR